MKDDENDAVLNLEAGCSDSSSNEVANFVEVPLGGALCSVGAANASRVACGPTALSGSSTTSSSLSIMAGVVPLCVKVEWFGWARLSLMPLFAVQDSTFSITPEAGNLGSETFASLEDIVWSGFERSVEEATNRLFKLILLGVACVRSPKVSYICNLLNELRLVFQFNLPTEYF